MKKKSSGHGFTLSVQAVVLIATAWAVISLLVFLLFSVPLPGQGRPGWYGTITYFLENFAFLAAGLLCLRNWRSHQIVSGRSVWLAIGLGMFSYFIGNLLLAYWEIGLGRSPEVSPGDFFFLATYVLLGWGMLQAILSRQLGLSSTQWLVLVGILIGSAALAYGLVLRPAGTDVANFPLLGQPAIAQTQAPAASPAAPATTPAAAPSVAPAAPVDPAVDPTAAPVETAPSGPAWANAIDALLEPYASFVLLLYLAGDIILVVMATALLLAFWGGRFSLSWRFIAAAALCFYVADLWFLYALYNIDNYETGALPEVFWIFSACLFCIGASLEYDLSTRSRRSSRRRTA